MLQMLHGVRDERVGGNTPELDIELMDNAMLGHSSAIDQFFSTGMPSPEGICTGHEHFK